MKLYDFIGAPNPKKVRIYLKEKGLDIELVPVDIVSQQNRQPEFLKKNPYGGVPVLELDDGRCFGESLAIIEYFEELHPEPPMIGITPEERMRVRGLERVCELGVMWRIALIFQNTHPFFAGRVKQVPEAAESARAQLDGIAKALDQQIGNGPFVAGPRVSIADCTLSASLDFGDFAGVQLDASLANIHRWREMFRQRPSASA